MLSFAIKNLKTKLMQTFLIIFSIIISAGVAILAYNVSTQVDQGITKNASYYSVIIGPSGSKTQLAMNSMYFTEEPLGTIPYSLVETLEQDGSKISSATPFAMADNYNGYNVIGTNSNFLKDKSIKSGQMFDDTETMQAVVGYKVAKNNNLKIGDVIYTSHSANSAQTHTEGITITGILKENHSTFDNVVFTQIRTLWEMHEHGEHQEGEEHSHLHESVCAILINTKNPVYAMQLVNEYNGKVITDSDGDSIVLQAIEPMNIVRDVLEEADDTKYIVYVLSAVILLMNVMIISIITLLNMYHATKEIKLMRLIGISMNKINLVYLIQNSLIGIISTILALALSKICLLFMNNYVASMGVVLNITKIFPAEILILLGVFIITVIPTVIWTFCMSKKDGIND